LRSSSSSVTAQTSGTGSGGLAVDDIGQRSQGLAVDARQVDPRQPPIGMARGRRQFSEATECRAANNGCE